MNSKHALSMWFFCIPFGVAGPALAASNPLDGLREDHPRLVALAADIERVKSLVKDDAQAALLYENFQKAALELADAKPVFFPAKGNMVGRSRTLLKRIYLLGLLAQLTPYSDVRRNYSTEAWRQLRPALNSSSWTPGRTPFLAVGEATYALAIAYDWFYADFDETQRSALREAIIRMGLTRYLEGTTNAAGWTKKQGNWAFVCHGGAMLGALAIATEEPGIATKVMEHAIPALSSALQIYSPDGAWWEGPNYWGYATRYVTYALSGMMTSLGHDFGLADARGFSETGLFAVYFTGPSGATFNFGDADNKGYDQGQMFWLAQRFGQPIYAWFQRENFVKNLLGRLQGKTRVLPVLEKDPGPYPVNLLWYSEAGGVNDLEALPLSRIFRAQDVEIGILRSGWGKNDVFLAIKGGLNRSGHAHLDLGTFVLDAKGYRWAMDLGKDSYQIPGYWDSKGGKRWDIYRVATRGHNTLLLNGGNQKVGAIAPLEASFGNETVPEILVDLTNAYRDHGVNKAVRHFTLNTAEQSVQIVDHVESRQSVKLEWAMNTEANTQVAGNQVSLMQHGQRMIVQALEPAGIEFKAEPASPGAVPPGQALNEGVTRLFFQHDILAGQQAEIRVEISSE